METRNRESRVSHTAETLSDISSKSGGRTTGGRAPQTPSPRSDLGKRAWAAYWRAFLRAGGRASSPSQREGFSFPSVASTSDVLKMR